MQNKFGNILRSLRVEHKMSQAALANVIGVTQQSISEWEQGNMEPTLSNLWALSDVFGISIDVLVGKSEY